MPSQNMLPKGKRRQSVKQEYRAQRTLTQEREAALRAAGEDPAAHLLEMPDTPGVKTHVSPFAGRPGLVTSGPSGGKHPQQDADMSVRRYPAPRVYAGPAPEVRVHDDLEPEDGVRSFTAEGAAAGMRLDAYLAKALPEVSRARVQLLTENGQVSVDGKAAKSKLKLKGGELIEIEGEPQAQPLHATPEAIPLTVVHEDDDLVVIDKPAGMMVHAGSGAPEHNAGTLVNALLYYFGQRSADDAPRSLSHGAASLSHGAVSLSHGAASLSQSAASLSTLGGALRPGIVHRLDKQTSGLIIVAKNDVTHRALSEMFSARRLRKVYLALVHGWVTDDTGTVNLPIARDLVRRTRMTTKRSLGPGDAGRSAVSHWQVLERLDGPYGRFTLLEVRIETGRTHQIRVHMQAIGHPVVGDFLYGAPHVIKPASGVGEALELPRNFLHAAELEFAHPRSGKELSLHADLPEELARFLEQLR
jgi:23S rRNA pseudouridine1911/1915/1917 synthase